MKTEGWVDIDFIKYLFLIFYFIPLHFSGDCSPVSGPMTCLMFATPVKGLELSEIWGLFIQICEIRSQQCNCVFSPLVVAVFLFSSCLQTLSIIFKVSKFFLFHARKFRSFVGSRTRVLSFHSLMFSHCSSQPRLIKYLFYAKKLFTNITMFLDPFS